MSLSSAIAALDSADAECVALEPLYDQALADARATGPQALIDRHQSRRQALFAIREAIRRCRERAVQVQP